LINIFTVDLEDWKHIHYLKSPDRIPERVEFNTGLILDLLEDYGVKATFFAVGEIAEEYPALIENILKRGHEIGFHTYHHTPLWDHKEEKLRNEIREFKKLMRENFNVKVHGFRAPLFSLDRRTSWAVKVLEEESFLYDSSVFPIRNLVYGEPRAPRTPFLLGNAGIVNGKKSSILELPPLTYRILGFNLPAAGGVYLRLLPERITLKAIEKFNESGYPAVIYVHPREVDPSPPKLNLPFYKEKIFTLNTRNTLKKLKTILEKFPFTSAINYIRGAYIE